MELVEKISAAEPTKFLTGHSVPVAQLAAGVLWGE